jgi:hypothetical protein
MQGNPHVRFDEKGSADARCAAGIPSIARIISGAPSHTTSSGSAASRRRMSLEELRAALRLLLAAPRRCVLNVIQSAAGQSIAVYGFGGSTSQG